MTTAEKLLKMKKKVSEADLSCARLEGQIKSSKDQLKSQHGCADVKEGEAALLKFGKKLEGKEAELEKGMKDLNEKYEW